MDFDAALIQSGGLYSQSPGSANGTEMADTARRSRVAHRVHWLQGEPSNSDVDSVERNQSTNCVGGKTLKRSSSRFGTIIIEYVYDY
jgi:hypothetical protein